MTVPFDFVELFFNQTIIGFGIPVALHEKETTVTLPPKYTETFLGCREMVGTGDKGKQFGYTVFLRQSC